MKPKSNRRTKKVDITRDYKGSKKLVNLFEKYESKELSDLDKVLSRFRIFVIRIKDFVLLSDNIELNPLHQRRDLNDDKKKRGIINSIVKGINIGQITLNRFIVDGRNVKIKDGVMYDGKNYGYESVDGGHRKRAILSFLRNEFTDINGKLFSQWEDTDKTKFLNYRLSFTIYDNLSSKELGTVFRDLNASTILNRQQLRNSHGDHEPYNICRDIEKTHSLFKENVFSFANDKLQVQEIIMEILTSFWKIMDGNRELIKTPVSQDDMDRYCEDPNFDNGGGKNQLRTIKKRTIQCLDFMNDMISRRREKYGKFKIKKDILYFYIRIYYWIFDTYGKNFYISKTDKDLFFNYIDDIWTKVNKSYEDFDMNNPEELKYVTKIPELKVLDRNYSPIITFLKCLPRTSETDMAWVVDFMKYENCNLDQYFQKSKDVEKRFFSEKTKQTVYNLQKLTCLVDSLFTKYQNMEGGHLIAYINGGRTTINNCGMLRKCWNGDMSNMDYEDYMDKWKKVNSEVENWKEFKFVHKYKNKKITDYSAQFEGVE